MKIQQDLIEEQKIYMEKYKNLLVEKGIYERVKSPAKPSYNAWMIEVAKVLQDYYFDMVREYVRGDLQVEGFVNDYLDYQTNVSNIYIIEGKIEFNNILGFTGVLQDENTIVNKIIGFILYGRVERALYLKDLEY